MKILYIGVEGRTFLGSAASLKILGHETFYLHPIRSKTQPFEIQTPEKTIVELFGGFRAEIPTIKFFIPRSIIPFTSWSLVHAIYQALEYLDFIPHVIVTDGARTFHFSYPLSRLFKVPLVLYIPSIRGLKFPAFLTYNAQYSEILRAPLSLLHQTAQSHLADLTITSERSTFRVLNRFLNNRIRVIEPTFARLASRNGNQKTKVDIFQPYALTIQTLYNIAGVRYGVEHAQLRIILSIANKVPELMFAVVGTSTADAKAIGINIPENVKFLGKIFDDDQLALLYKQAVCVVSPVLLLLQSNRFLETLYYGKPIITTSNCTFFYKGLISGRHAMIEDRFDKYPYRVRQILNDSHFRKKLEKGALTFFASTFSPLKHAKSIQTLLESVVRRR